jgi:hypothetical protein
MRQGIENRTILKLRGEIKMRNIENERRFLMDHFPDMAERIAKASDKAITIAYDMLQLDDEELQEFGQYLESRAR